MSRTRQRLQRRGKQGRSNRKAQEELPSALGAEPQAQIVQLQRQLGNRKVADMLQNETMPDQASGMNAIDERIGTGRSLDNAAKTRMEAAFGEDFSDVRVHTDSAADGLTRQKGARALTLGSEIAFESGTYQPQTPHGDALLAHELAHVVQQRRAVEAGAEARAFDTRVGPQDALERDADRSARGVFQSMWFGLKNTAATVGQRVKPVMRNGARLRLSGCSNPRYANLEPPDFLGERSLETLRTINRRLEAADILEDTLIAGPLIVLFTSTPAETVAQGGYPLEEQVRAVQAVPAIVRNRVLQDIDLLLVMHGNELNDQERAYWNRIRSRFDV